MNSEDQYEVSVSNYFDATSPEDAVSQMATWLSSESHPYRIGYRVTNQRTGQSVFVDAEDIDWNALSED